MTTIGIPAEVGEQCKRVSLHPDVIADLRETYPIEVCIEAGAGEPALFEDGEYEEAGANITDRQTALSADIVTLVEAHALSEFQDMGEGQVLMGMIEPLQQGERIRTYAERGLRTISMELIPRISRAQKMDVLSAMGSLAGYRAAIEAAEALPKFFPLLTTAAGTIRPADVLVLGAGVAGLQAIATAKRLGARVTGYDIREAAREEIQSLGADFLEIQLETSAAESEGGYAREQDDEFKEKQPQLLAPHIGDSDIVITTAQIPGRPAPTLITEEAVEQMAPASVILDLAAPSGGNCALTEPGETIRHPNSRRGVQIRGPLDLPDRMPSQASRLYGKCVGAMIETILDDDGNISIDTDDDIIDSALVCADGEIRDERLQP